MNVRSLATKSKSIYVMCPVPIRRIWRSIFASSFDKMLPGSFIRSLTVRTATSCCSTSKFSVGSSCLFSDWVVEIIHSLFSQKVSRFTISFVSEITYSSRWQLTRRQEDYSSLLSLLLICWGTVKYNWLGGVVDRFFSNMVIPRTKKRSFQTRWKPTTEYIDSEYCIYNQNLLTVINPSFFFLIDPFFFILPSHPIFNYPILTVTDL